MDILKVEVWTIGDAAGYVVARGNLEIIMNSGSPRKTVLQEANRLAFICNAALYIDGVSHSPYLAKDWRTP